MRYPPIRAGTLAPPLGIETEPLSGRVGSPGVCATVASLASVAEDEAAGEPAAGERFESEGGLGRATISARDGETEKSAVASDFAASSELAAGFGTGAAGEGEAGAGAGGAGAEGRTPIVASGSSGGVSTIGSIRGA